MPYSASHHICNGSEGSPQTDGLAGLAALHQLFCSSSAALLQLVLLFPNSAPLQQMHTLHIRGIGGQPMLVSMPGGVRGRV